MSFGRSDPIHILNILYSIARRILEETIVTWKYVTEEGLEAKMLNYDFVSIVLII